MNSWSLEISMPKVIGVLLKECSKFISKIVLSIANTNIASEYDVNVDMRIPVLVWFQASKILQVTKGLDSTEFLYKSIRILGNLHPSTAETLSAVVGESCKYLIVIDIFQVSPSLGGLRHRLTLYHRGGLQHL